MNSRIWVCNWATYNTCIRESMTTPFQPPPPPQTKPPPPPSPETQPPTPTPPPVETTTEGSGDTDGPECSGREDCDDPASKSDLKVRNDLESEYDDILEYY